MNQSSRFTIALLFAASLAGVAWVIAGPLDPPAGPVSSGGKTTQEIFDAVTGVGNAAAAAGRGPGIPGLDTGAGTIEFPAVSSFPAVTTPILGLVDDISASHDSTGGGTVSKTTFNKFTVIRDLAGSTAASLRFVTTGYVANKVVVKLNSPGGTITYTLSTVRMTGRQVYLAQRADGTFAQLEVLSFLPEKIQVSGPGGAFEFSFKTGTGT